MYIVRVPGKQREFMDFLGERGIGTGVHYIANHIQPLFRKYSSNELPLTSKLWNEIVTIPLHCRLSDNDIQKTFALARVFARPPQAPLRGAQKGGRVRALFLRRNT